MKDVKNKKRAGGGFFSSVGEGVSTQLARWRTSPSALLSDLAALAVAFLFARCHIVFGARPVAMGFIALLPSRVFAALIGAALGALSLGSGGAAYAIIYTLTVALRIILSGALGEGGRPFEESLPVRLSIATVGGFVLSVYQLLVAGFGAAELLFGLSMTLLSPVACFILAGIFDTGIAFGDFWRGPAELLSFEGRTGVSWRELLLFHLSALAFSTLIALSLSELELFGFSFAYVYVACATLFAAKRFGAVRGAAVGFFSALPLSAIHSVSFALAGAASGVMFTVGALYGVGAGAIALAAWSAYTGGGIGLLATLPEYAVGGALMLPFVNKTLKKEIEEEPAAPTENAGEMVAAMTLAYRSRPSNALDSLEEALIGISSAARCYGTGGGVSEAEYRELVLSSAKSFDARGGEVARELCIEKSAVIAARLRSGESLSAPMLGLSDPVSAELCDLISRRAAGLGEERYKRRLSDSAYEDYRLISKLLNDARTREDSERAPDPELGERLSLFLAECGLPGGIVKVFGSRRKHIIAAGEDPSGGIIASPEVRSGTERILGTRLGEAEYFRRGATVLMEAEATRLFSAASASATISGSSGEVSGDLSDSFESGDDYFYSILSDGMGSGELARETSGFVIDFLGHTLGTGGFRDTSLHLLNHIIRRRGEECSATVDLFELDLITGDAVFIKSGAAPSYVKRGSSIFRIKSETAPIGLMQNVDAERMRVEIRDGDYVIMLSDGVSSTPEDAPWLLELLAEPPRSSLKEYAEFILSEAVKRSASGDDMTVVITRIETAERDKSKE